MNKNCKYLRKLHSWCYRAVKYTDTEQKRTYSPGMWVPDVFWEGERGGAFTQQLFLVMLHFGRLEGQKNYLQARAELGTLWAYLHVHSAVLGSHKPEEADEIKEEVMDAVRWLMRWANRQLELEVPEQDQPNREDKRIQAILALRKASGLGLSEAISALSAVPDSGSPKEWAERAMTALEERTERDQ